MTLISDIESIKALRNEFLNDFVIKSDLTTILTEASDNNILNSIRIHKYLTSTALIGKVKTARFLESIELTEKTTIKQLSETNIRKIASFVSEL
uniref:MedDCM-OCT-S43-C55-cds31 n=1 Tax=Candidatus Actinomarina minuta TaxID=1389454 RepID=S5DYC2_9ACTN|nr:MedDCM-OCT-S43-C55-cds31 [Candidatus Actinomarina minuta]